MINLNENIPDCLPADFLVNKKKIRAARKAAKALKSGYYNPDLIDRTFWY